MATLPVKATDGHCVENYQRDHLGLGHRNAGLFRQGHRGVLDQRRVHRLVVEKLDDPGLAIDVDERLGFGAPQGAAATRDDAGLQRGQRLGGFNLGHHLAQGLSVFQPGQRPT